MAFIEAQACGLPVVAGNAGGVGAVVAAGRTGLLVPVGDAEAFAEATRRLLTDAGLRQRMAREAAAYVRAEHDLPVAAARIDAVLRARRVARAAAARPVPTPIADDRHLPPPRQHGLERAGPHAGPARHPVERAGTRRGSRAGACPPTSADPGTGRPDGSRARCAARSRRRKSCPARRPRASPR